MGVDMEHYVVMGYDFKTRESCLKMTGEEIEIVERIADDCGMEVIFDGMCGDYMIVGEVLAKSSSTDRDDGSFDCIFEFENIDTIYNEVQKYFNEFIFTKGRTGNIKLFVFTHSH